MTTTTLYICPVCIAAFRLEQNPDTPAPGILTCPLCGCSAVRIADHERTLIETAYHLHTRVRTIIADRAQNTT